jgi:hemerythrin
MLTLTKDMETGIAKIDEQHRELITRLNAAITMGSKAISKEETQKTLDFLEKYVIKHFGEEEVLQMGSRYPKYDWHKGQHKAYVAEIKKMEKEFAEHGPSAKFTVALNTSLVNWLVRHIKIDDAEFARHYKAQTK